MHYWGYVMERLRYDDPSRRTRRSGSSRRATKVRDERVWSRTTPRA
jgi:hypothetical protein